MPLVRLGLTICVVKSSYSLVRHRVYKTRMHSSRMRTGCSLTICCSVLPRGGGSPWSWGGGVLLGSGGFSLVRRGCVCLVRGGSPWSQGGGSPETPPVNRITDTCTNITLATTSSWLVITLLFCLGSSRQSLKVHCVKCIPQRPCYYVPCSI